MPGGDEITELRALQERAYGRAGELTPADAARLRELEDHAAIVSRDSGATEDRTQETGAALAPVDSPPVGPTTVARSAGAEELPVVSRTNSGTEATRILQGAGPADGASAGPELEEGADSEPRRASVLRTRWKLLAGVLLVAILVGVLLGWALFSPRAPQAIPLDATQQSWQDEILVSGKYDSGSVRAIAEEDGAIVWFATRDDGETVCAIISDGVTTAPACRGRELALMQGVQTSLRRDVEGGEGRVDAQVQFDAEGDPAVRTSSYLVGTGVGVYATEAEQRTAEHLMESGYSPASLMIVGHDGDVPVWIGVETDSARWCLIYDGSSSPLTKACDETGALMNDGGVLTLTHLDVEAGASAEFEYRFGPGSSYLQITRSADDADS